MATVAYDGLEFEGTLTTQTQRHASDLLNATPGVVPEPWKYRCELTNFPPTKLWICAPELVFKGTVTVCNVHTSAYPPDHLKKDFAMPIALGYIRVSTDQQAERGVGFYSGCLFIQDRLHFAL
jgi:hypothetical protein